MARIRFPALIGLTLLPALAAAVESTAAPSPARASYFVCIASPTPYGKLFYASRVFEDRSHMGQPLIQDSFRKHLIQKYGYPEKQGRIQCPAGPTANAVEQIKMDRVSQMAVVETDWIPAD
jgi:hypothetical protein